MGKEVIKEPFCVINCDDFYGRDAFVQIAKFLSNLPEGTKNQYAMVGFRCCNTLSENGSVARGVKWFGVTYAADREATVNRIQQLVDEGVYPDTLF